MSQPVLIVSALKEELKDFKGHLKNLNKITYKNFIFMTGELGPTKIFIVQSGVGMERAEQAIKIALDVVTPSCIIVTGFCGATQTHIRVSDLIISEKLIFKHVDSDFYTSHEELLTLAQSLAKKRGFCGTTLTTNVPIYKASLKLALGGKTNCLAVNMEGYAVAQVAKEFQIPFIEVRSVLDTAEEDLVEHSQSKSSSFFKQKFEEWKKSRSKRLAQNALTPFLVSFVSKINETKLC